MKKKIIGVALFCAVVTQGLSFASYDTIFERTSTPITIADGVTQTEIQKFTDEGWININLIEVDLEQSSKMTVVTDTYLKNRDKLSTLVSESEESEAIVAAVNSDFFDTANNTTMGTLIKSGEVLSTSVGYDEFASFNISKSGLPFIGYINTPKNTFSNGVTTLPITYINKPYLNYDRTIMYTSKWGEQSYGNTAGMAIYEMLVVNDVIKEIRYNGEPFSIPENGYVLASVGANISAVSNTYKIGDTITINYDANFDAIELAIGGGAQILVRGEVPTTFSQNITGNNPRTALGINKARTKLFMITVDGRTGSYRGVTQTELAQILLSLGAYEAINLDGGGSTEMLVKTPFDESAQIVNTPSDGTERNMYTGLVVVKEITDNPVLKSIQIKETDSVVLLGQQVALELIGIDSNYETTAIDASNVSWTFDGMDGTMENGIFTPYESGNVTLHAEYMGLSASQTLKVHNDVVAVTVSPSELKLTEGESKALTFYVKTADGTEIEMSPDMLTMLLPDNLGTFNMDSQTFTASETVQQGYFSVGFNDLVTYVPVAIGTEKALIFDFETTDKDGDVPVNFMSYPAEVTGRYKTMQFAKNGDAAGMIAYDFTTTTATRAAYMTFESPIVLPENTEAIGLWAYGNYGNDHWLRGKIVDADGVSTNITFARNVNWEGWQYVSADLPDNLKAPFMLERIYMVETDPLLMDEGTIVIDDISAVVGQAISIELPESTNKTTNLEDYKVDADNALTLAVNYISDASSEAIAQESLDSTGYRINTNSTSIGYQLQSKQNIWLMTFNNGGGSIIDNGKAQWQNFLSQKDSLVGMPLLVVMKDQETFSDPLEEELFYEQLAEVNESGLDVTVLYPTEGDYDMRMVDGVRILQLPVSIDEKNSFRFFGSGSTITFEKE